MGVTSTYNDKFEWPAITIIWTLFLMSIHQIANIKDAWHKDKLFTIWISK